MRKKAFNEAFAHLLFLFTAIAVGNLPTFETINQLI